MIYFSRAQVELIPFAELITTNPAAQQNPVIQIIFTSSLGNKRIKNMGEDHGVTDSLHLRDLMQLLVDEGKQKGIDLKAECKINPWKKHIEVNCDPDFSFKTYSQE